MLNESERKGISGRLHPSLKPPACEATFDISPNDCYKVIFYLFHWQEVLLSDKKSLSALFLSANGILATGRPAPFNRDDAIRVFPSFTSRDKPGSIGNSQLVRLLWQNAF